MSDEPELLGREEILGRCRVGLADGGGVLLTGPAGIGRSAVLDAVAAEAAREGALVLRSRPSSAEAALPFVALYDLFDAVLTDTARELVAPHLRAVLDVALLRTPSQDPPDGLAVRVAVLELLRALAAHRDVLVTLDDAQCLDPDSAGVIGFAARRLHGHRVALAVAERIEDGGEPVCLDLLPAARTELPVGPLPGSVIGELLRTRAELAAGDRLSRRIQAASGGNPHYALELAAAARRAAAPVRADDPLPVPARLRALFADRLAAVPAAARDTLLLVAAATPPHPRPPGAAGTGLPGGAVSGPLEAVAARGGAGGGAGEAPPIGSPGGSASRGGVPGSAPIGSPGGSAPRGGMPEPAPISTSGGSAPRGGMPGLAPSGTSAGSAPRGGLGEAPPTGTSAGSASRGGVPETAPIGTSGGSAPRGGMPGLAPSGTPAGSASRGGVPGRAPIGSPAAAASRGGMPGPARRGLAVVTAAGTPTRFASRSALPGAGSGAPGVPAADGAATAGTGLPVAPATRVSAGPGLAAGTPAAPVSLAWVPDPSLPGVPAPASGLMDALAARVVMRGPGGELRFAHPLLREIVYADAGPQQRQECHARLAATLDDPLERARHRALATPHPDAAVAAELARAADLAVGRGAPALAAELARLAAERTPADPALAAERLLSCARHSYDAGLTEQAAEACTAVLRVAPAGRHARPGGNAARVGARLLLVEMAGGDRAGVPALLDAAEADAGEVPYLRAAVLLCRADHVLSTGRMGQGLAVLAAAERHACRGGDLDQQMEVVALRASIEMQYRPDRVVPSLRHAAALAARRPGPAITTASVQVRCCEVVWLLRGGDVPGALAAVNGLRADVERAGLVKDLARVLHMVASVHERAGLCAAAHRAALLGGRMLRDLHTASGPGLLLSAAAELAGGTAERAGDLADAAIRAAGQAGDAECAAIAHGLRGRADLLLGRTADAAETLGRCRAMLRGLGLVDPAYFLVDADLAEALSRTGRAGEARLLLSEAAAEAGRLDRTVVTLGLARAAAVLDAVDGDPRGAADRLRAALTAGHPYPLEAARARLTLGELERRARRRAAARTELAAAVRAFAAAECVPWLAFARERLAGLDEPGAVSDADRRIVELVRSGATNRQIAASLHVSVKSVEASLTRMYRRFGVHGRTELTARHAAGLGA